ncbi:MAG: hypothetical protein J6V49_05000 [Bacteroidales bacterium]|nr:hypothetical protein [Bacteroidales bacterium]
MELMAKECIAPNLYLLTKANSNRYYIARFKRNGKQIERSLGNADTISLREAKLNLARVMVGFEETDKRPETKSLCFADALPMALNDIAVIKQWRNEKSRLQWEQTLRDYALPLLGPLALSDITRADILAVIKPIWFTKNETASRLRMRLEAILSWAIHHGYRTDANPAVWKANLEFDLPSKGKVQTVEHHEALTLDEARKVVSYCLSHPSPVSAAILFGIATASRVNEFRMATREEIDGDVWLVPPERRKDGRPYPHRVPLSSLAKKALEMAAAEGPLFVANRRVIAADSPRLKLIAILGRKVTMHGCRSTFRDWCAVNGIDHALAEKALSHKWGSNVTQAYLREDMLEQRRGLMEVWAEALMTH